MSTHTRTPDLVVEGAPTPGADADILTHEDPADPERRRGKVRQWSIDHWLSVIAMVVSAAFAAGSLMLSQRASEEAITHQERASDEAIAYQERVRERGQAERVVFLVNADSWLVQNYSNLPIITVELEVVRGGPASTEGMVISFGSLLPCQQVSAKLRAVRKVEREVGGRLERVRFTDPANRQWVRTADGQLRRGEGDGWRNVKPEGDEAVLIPPAVGLNPDQIALGPIKGCVPG